MKHTAAVASSKANDPRSCHEQRLTASHLRPTIARTSVLDALAKAAPRCLDANQVYRLLSPGYESLTPAAIYRALNDLWTAGLLIRITEGIHGRALYAPKPERQDIYNVILRCHCGARLIFIEDRTLQEGLRSLAAREGFDLDNGAAFTITLMCEHCQQLHKRGR